MTGSRVTPVYGVLVQPLLIAGVEKPFAIVNVTLGLVMAGELHFYGWLILTLLTHAWLKKMTKNDSFTRKIYIKYNRQGDVYESWLDVHSRRTKRPAGYGWRVSC